VVDRGSITTLPDPRLGPVAMTNVYPRFESADCAIRTTGPAVVGQHTDEVLRRDLGLSDEELAALRLRGITDVSGLAS
jgi:crotonobetainyl-CoA:carnitine CoA-transferase CaiB-like acyl-CoA transferase